MEKNHLTNPPPEEVWLRQKENVKAAEDGMRPPRVFFDGCDWGRPLTTERR